jgi:hypothetical protein
MTLDGKDVRLIDYIYQETCGLVPEGYKVILKCKNPLCINHKHLGLRMRPKKTQERGFNGYCRNCGEYGFLTKGFCSRGCLEEFKDLTSPSPPSGRAGKLFGFKVYQEIYKIRRDIDDLIVLEDGERFYLRTPKIHVLSTREEKLHEVLLTILGNQLKFLNLLGFLATSPTAKKLREYYYNEVLKEGIYLDRERQDILTRKADAVHIL